MRIENEEEKSIAIIGASYAGLSLANTLKQKSSSISFTIFDSKTLPFTYVTGGDAFNVPSYSSLAKKLSLKTSVRPTDNGLTRQDVIESLLERVAQHVIVGTRIERIEKRNNVFYLHTRQKVLSSDDGLSTERIYGPYQCVIGADGVCSKCRTCALHGIFLIGDARWVNDRWYDLGLRRIRRGADIAIQDGVELGEMLSTAMKMKPAHEEIDFAFQSFPEAMRATYCARQIQMARMTRILSVLVVLSAVAVMKNHSMMQSFLQSLLIKLDTMNVDALP